MADVDGRRPARGNAELLNEGGEAERGVREDHVMLRGGKGDEQQRSPNPVRDDALQGASPSTSPQADLTISEEPTEQAGDAAEEQWTAGGEHELQASEFEVRSQVWRDPAGEEGPSGVAAKIHQAQRPHAVTEEHSRPGEWSGWSPTFYRFPNERALGGVDCGHVLRLVTEVRVEAEKPDDPQCGHEEKCDAPSERTSEHHDEQRRDGAAPAGEHPNQALREAAFAEREPLTRGAADVGKRSGFACAEEKPEDHQGREIPGGAGER